MGIKKLLAFLRELNPNIVQQFSITEIKGHRIAFDLSILCYTKKSDAVRNQVKQIRDPIYENPDYEYCKIHMIREILKIISIVLEGGCVPVMVFDGPPPTLKAGTKEIRAGLSNTKKDNIAGLRRIAKGLLNDNNFKITEGDLQFLKKFEKSFMKKHKRHIESIDDIRWILKNQLNQFVVVTKQDQELLQSVFSNLGIPFVKALSEAEQTCAHMCLMKDVIAIYTTDSDCLVFGCPIMINKIEYNSGARRKIPAKLQCYTFENTLKVIQLSHQQFIDFCILMGTDYNSNPSGYGPEKHYDFIKIYGSINGIKQAQKDIKAKSIESLSSIEHLLIDYDLSHIKYNEIVDYFTDQVKYDRSNLDLTIKDDHFNTSLSELNDLLGGESVIHILDFVRKISDLIPQVNSIRKTISCEIKSGEGICVEIVDSFSELKI